MRLGRSLRRRRVALLFSFPRNTLALRPSFFGFHAIFIFTSFRFHCYFHFPISTFYFYLQTSISTGFSRPKPASPRETKSNSLFPSFGGEALHKYEFVRAAILCASKKPQQRPWPPALANVLVSRCLQQETRA